MAVGPDFYGANQFTAYPFTRELQPFTRAFIDAVVSVESLYASTDIRLVYAVVSTSSPRKVEVVSGSTVLISRDDPVAVEAMGVYEVLTVVGDHGRATFAIKPDEVDGVFDDASGLLFVEHVVSGIAVGEVSAVHSNSVEVAAPGSLLSLVLGANMEAEVDGSSLVLHARYRDDGPCTPIIAPRNPGILRINGEGPDDEGNFQLVGQANGVVLVDNAPEDNKVSILNTGEACCDCEDYERLFNYTVVTHERLLSVRSWTLSNQTRYTALNNYLKFLLQTDIVDANYDEDWEATCNS